MASKLLTYSHFDGTASLSRGVGGVIGDPAGATLGVVVRSVDARRTEPARR